MTTYTAAQIIRIGGREWTKGDMHRVYINADVWAPLVGLEIEHYKSGNICGAELNGAKISNARASRLTAIKVYWENGQLYITRDAELFHQIRDAIAREVADTEPAPPSDEPPAAGAGTKVTALREAGRTVRQIAEMIGVSVSTIYRWARGICRPRPANAAALAAIA